jgi:hypothetical protein
MHSREITQHGDWQVATAIGRGGKIVSWAKMGIIQGTSPIDEPGEYVWFEFGNTREEAREKLLDELGLRYA